MNLNGQTLKICFLMIMITLCCLLIGLTVAVCFKVIPITDYAHLIGILGISTLFGAISQAFVHSNIAEALKIQTTTDSHSTTTPTPSPTEVKP